MTDVPERRTVELPDVPFDDDEELIFSQGVDYAILIVAQQLGVHPDDFSWDAATEEFEGDVRAVVGNLLQRHWEAARAAQGALLEKAAAYLENKVGGKYDPAACVYRVIATEIRALSPDALAALREHEDRIRQEERDACAKIAEAERKKHAAETYSGGTVSVHRSGQSAARCYAAGHIVTLIKERDGQ